MHTCKIIKIYILLNYIVTLITFSFKIDEISTLEIFLQTNSREFFSFFYQSPKKKLRTLSWMNKKDDNFFVIKESRVSLMSVALSIIYYSSQSIFRHWTWKSGKVFSSRMKVFILVLCLVPAMLCDYVKIPITSCGEGFEGNEGLFWDF